MTLISSLNTGWTGLRSNSEELSVVGDNIANVNTIGFKGSRAEFEEALAHTTLGGQIGMGTELQAVHRILTQGSLIQTGQSTDLALQGSGFFMVQGNHAGVDATYYTRAGQFALDKDGFLVNLEGLRVQGHGADEVGTIGAAIGDMNLGTASSQPHATETLSITANLMANSTTPATPFDPADPVNTSNFSTTLTVFDSLGDSHDVQVYFRNNGAGAWEWHALTDGSGLAGGTPGTATEIATGTLTFDNTGKLVDVTQSSNFNPANAVAPQALNFDFGDPINAGGTGLAGITQFVNPSAVNVVKQDGFAAGVLASVDLNEQGVVIGTFTNGQTRTLGQVVVADFTAEEQLTRVGGNLYAQSMEAGEPTVGTAGAGGRGSIISGALEQSNVDMAGEFVRMIAAQRAFQANSKTISTADQLLGELMQLKR